MELIQRNAIRDRYNAVDTSNVADVLACTFPERSSTPEAVSGSETVAATVVPETIEADNASPTPTS